MTSWNIAMASDYSNHTLTKHSLFKGVLLFCTYVYGSSVEWPVYLFKKN